MVQYVQKRVSGIQDFEKRLNNFGKNIGIRYIEIFYWRDKLTIRRENRIIPLLSFINTLIWKSLSGKPADSLEKSTENEDEYMITDNDPWTHRFISMPKDLHQLNCGAIMAGIIESILEGANFPCKVSAHTVPIEGFPNRTTYLIKFDQMVIERQKLLEST
ncbi:transport protein particle component [Rozella allomycis CSF55]|uniref:Trafficking protein particle complex subunit n=1 Tax=Rozella allomycis (strain CSF55) TaxID=988480 RepID=A0A4P9YP17_ROZAC|nr:transport protein particle component [Rozella allomycis CSF55]